MATKKTENENVEEVKVESEAKVAKKTTTAKKTTKTTEPKAEKAEKKSTTKTAKVKEADAEVVVPKAEKKAVVKEEKAEKEADKEVVENAEKKTATPKKVAKTKTAIKENVIVATGRRKESIARVRMFSGNGKVTINDKDVNDYLTNDYLRKIYSEPLVLTNTTDKFDINVNVIGGGLTGQAGAIRHGISRALVIASETYKAELKKAGFLTRDSRVKERKKYGLKKARKAPQFSKR